MKFLDLLKDKIPFFIYNLALFLIIAIVIYLSPNKAIAVDVIGYIGIFQLFFMTIFICISIFHKKKFISNIEEGMSNSDFNEVNFFNKNNEEAYYYRIIKTYYEKLDDFMYEKEKEYNENLDLITVWGHDIKTPISVIKLLCENYEVNKNPELIDSMPRELFKIEDGVNKMLNLTRINNFEKDFFIEKIDLEDIVFNIVKKHTKYFISKKIKLEINIDKVSILSDVKWLSFIIEQIINNSLKYTDNNGNISIRGVKGDSCYLLKIRDDGVGIKTEDLPRVFQKGFTGTNGRENLNSTGIGLYLTEQVIKKIGHNIYIRSEYGTYTEVVLEFNNEEIR
ncbi:MAG: ATP-binding protein [Clostridiaceae bacterium]